jgi:UDP-2,3-diacylglucosamine pyrophosphatase LpxH
MTKTSRYQENINRGLTQAHTTARVTSVDLSEAKWIIFSDHHKGNGDSADDFQPSMSAYVSALSHYYEEDYTLAVLGDAEELWENSPNAVLRTYAAILDAENTFHKQGRYWRFWGNHDDEWRNPSQVRFHLGRFYQHLSVLESLRITINDHGVALGEIFLVHGHQGNLFSDRLGWLSRFFVRYFWRPIQRIFKIVTNTPATDRRLRHKHDIAMYNWSAVSEGLILLAGHTHHPIFPTLMRTRKLEQIYETIRELSTDPEEVEEAETDLEFARAQRKPSYLNTGCCCFSDGRITGIEISEGEIKLGRWPDEIGRPQPEVLDRFDLRQMLEQVKTSSPPMEIPRQDP